MPCLSFTLMFYEEEVNLSFASAGQAGMVKIEGKARREERRGNGKCRKVQSKGMEEKVGKVPCMERKDNENMSKQSFCAYFVPWMISEQKCRCIWRSIHSPTWQQGPRSREGKGHYKYTAILAFWFASLDILNIDLKLLGFICFHFGIAVLTTDSVFA